MKTGRKPKLNDPEAREVYAILSVGGSLADAADYLGVARSTLTLRLSNDARFRQGVDRAAANGKLRLIKKVGKAKPWQAAAWMLERKWGAEFGRKDTLRQEVTGADGGPIEHAVIHKFDHDRFAELYRRRTGGIVAGDGTPAPDRN